jgi:hypothetical protein
MTPIQYHILNYSKKRQLVAIIPIILILLVSGCSSTYHAMSLGILDYTQCDTVKGISYGYHFNSLRDFRNNKYAEKENQKNIKLVAFNITNLSGRRIDLVNNLEYYQNNTRLIKPMEPNSIYSTFKLNPKKYLADLSLIIVNAYWIESYGVGSDADLHFRIIPIGIFIGPILTLYNMSTVKKSNLMFGKDLDKYSPFTSIEAGAKRFVLIPFEDIGEQPIQIRIRGSNK